jgi:hypothetical protein
LYKVEDTLALKEELENLREKLNIDVIRIIKDKTQEEYESLLNISRKLDDVIVNYIKSSINKSKTLLQVK